MRNPRCRFALLTTLALVAACASTKVSDRVVVAADEKLAKPEHMYVYNFAATPADVPADSALAEHTSTSAPTQTADQIAAGRKLGSEIAGEMVKQLRTLGLPADRASASTAPAVNDIVIKGYLFSVEEGSGTKRVVLGFGAGTAELKTAVEGYQMTAQGLRKLGSGSIDSTGSKTPGVAVPLAVAVATANPVGLIVVGGAKAYGELSGKNTIEGKAKATADQIVTEMKPRMRQQGWID